MAGRPSIKPVGGSEGVLGRASALLPCGRLPAWSEVSGRASLSVDWAAGGSGGKSKPGRVCV